MAWLIPQEELNLWIYWPVFSACSDVNILCKQGWNGGMENLKTLYMLNI